ncbi:NADH-cytochrome b5 reductase-like protein isoform X2 [Amborella trichopoda]|uniref:NADH-cytochrome b5 reductase-like protein isoform X2 n=1 Tax=Amborella trichopoda TaxID=13333 RepID=UPI0005D3B215|nr:NADH-cytochrome b5 reductase-like protein isoform X2 [Amborella trichopoda]|eukprot:XP_011622802.1 NADH-cytochrome b5 reductase-like protein isoform X2 [Amborella trichopoda]
MALLLKRFARTAPVALRSRAQSNLSSMASSPSFHTTSEELWKKSKAHFGAISAISGGLAYLYLFSDDKVQLDSQPEDSARSGALNPEKWIQFKLLEKAKVSPNTHLFRFSFDHSLSLGLRVASCILTRAPFGKDSEGKTKYVIRPYTPISDPDSKGYFDLMIAGGTGITPMLQVIEAILKNPDDNTQISLLYANISPDDILLKEKLDMLSANHPNLKIFYTVDKPSQNWRGGAGYISNDMIIKGLPVPSDDTLILVCGPPGMMKHISGDKAKDRSQGELSGLLKEVGYTEEMVYKF